LVWLDLQFASEDEKALVEKRFGINFREQLELSTVESNSRFYESEGFIYINSNFIVKQDNFYTSHPVVFFLIGNILITQRDADLPSFAESVKKIKRNRLLFKEGRDILEVIFETKVDIDADFMELIGKEITFVSKGLSLSTTNEEELLIKINTYQENAMMLRESFIDKQRVVSSLLKCQDFKNDSRLRIVIKDINSMLEAATFIFARLEYLQNTLLGMINMQQNKTIKIFTIVSVIFMPPTLIASIYGMNFNFMPEIQWRYGYLFAIGLIVMSSLLTLYVFKIKKWL
jgi:magnesium transporter